MSRITIDELEKYLWGSAELLRTSIDAGSYKQYIFPLLFLKRLSDVYDEESKKAEKEYGPEALEWEETHLFKIPDGAHWEDIRNVSSDIGLALTRAFSAIEKANPEKLQGIFGDAAWTNKNRLPDRLLKDLIEHFSSQILSLENCPEDELGTGYEYLIKKFADDSGHTAQEFYTNRTVVHLMTEMLQPQPGESVYDPTCGSAGMLISCIQYLQDHGQEWRNLKIYGQEINNLTSAIGRMNLFLHGVEDFKIANGDTLKNPAFIEDGKLQTFNIVLSNPPYSISQWDREAFASDKYGRNFLGVPSQGIADFAFLQHIIKSMNPENGRSASLLPRGILSRYAEIDMRKKLVSEDIVESVIAVGKGLFYNSPMEACVLICNTNKNVDRKGTVLFINASNLIRREGTQNYLTDEHIHYISDVYQRYKEEEGFSKVVTNEEIIRNEGSMNISLYVPQSLSEDNDDSLDHDIPHWMNASSQMHNQLNLLRNMLGE